MSQFTQWEEPFWTKELARLSQGRFSAQIVPFDRAAIQGVQMLPLLQLGVVPFGTMLMSNMSAQYPQFAAPDLAGLNPDMHHLRVSLSAFRPYLEQSLREDYGIEPLAIYVYPAQVIFCKKTLHRLADLSGRRIRVSSSTQADFVGALGGVAVRIAFAQLAQAFQSGSVDCAITGVGAGNTLKLYTVAKHLYAMPLTWGLAIFGANQAAWEALPSELKALLRTELPQLEHRIWTDAQRATTLGIQCDSDAANCLAWRKNVTVVPMSAQDDQLRQEIFRTSVLPRWLQRCSMDCSALWRTTIGAARGIALPTPP
ncbi:MAG: TRAP transporter substrate-binding protein [Rhodoferax sp.]|nr:TRAP transporter substrate-binding protein [Rhodoferax sp.]